MNEPRAHLREMPATLHILELLLRLRRLDRSLRRGQPRDRNPKRRTRHIIEPQLMAQLDAGWISAMLAANTDLQFPVYFASAFDRDSHQRADPDRIELLERAFLINPAVHVILEELARVIARNSIGHLR